MASPPSKCYCLDSLDSSLEEDESNGLLSADVIFPSGDKSCDAGIFYPLEESKPNGY